MRPLGWFLIVVGLVVGAGFWLVPTEISVLGTTGSCGPPIERLLSDNRHGIPEVDEFNLRQACHDRSTERVVVGLVLGGILGIAGVIFTLTASTTPKPTAFTPTAAPTGPLAPAAAAGWYPDPWGQAAMRWWDGTQWGSQTATPPSATPPEQPPAE